MATFDPRKRTVQDINLQLASAATCPAAIASAGNTSVTSTNKVDLRATTFIPNVPPRVNIEFPKGLALTSNETLEIRIQDCATSGGTYATILIDQLTNEALSSEAVVSLALAEARRYVHVILYLSNTAGTSDLSSYTYTAWIDPLVA